MMLNFSVIDKFRRRSRGQAASAATTGLDSLELFGFERSDAAPAPRPRSATGFAARLAVPRARVGVFIIMGIILAGGLAASVLLEKWRAWKVQAASGSVTIESDPAGADVVVDGRSRGATPVTLAVAPGDYMFNVVQNGRSRPLKITVSSGASAVHYVHFDASIPPAIAATTGSQPSAAVTRLASKPPTPAGPAAGWLSVQSAIPLDILEGANIVGTSQAAKIMLPVGRHELRFANNSLGFFDRRSVDVRPGATASIRMNLPNAPLSINAQPWAEVWVDGSKIGDTPIGNYHVAIGSHELMLRHPDLGEVRQSVSVSLTMPARVSVDMRKH